jgi:hypothetical protein
MLVETERLRGSKEAAMKFDTWSGQRELTFIIPRNFSNLSQKSGGRSAGAAAAVNHTNAAA